MNVVREIERINTAELINHVPFTASWHYKYIQSAYIFVASLDFQLTEGDLIVIFSQFGEIVDCNLVRDKKTGKSRGFAFIAYEDTRSCALAVDNFNGAKICNRVLRVDHVLQYRRPKGNTKQEQETDGIELPSEDEDYDERRKQIWDYTLYESSHGSDPSTNLTEAVSGVIDSSTSVGQPSNSSSLDNVALPDHMLQIRAKRKARMNQAFEQEKADEAEVQAKQKAREEAKLKQKKLDEEKSASQQPSLSSSKKNKIDWGAVARQIKRSKSPERIESSRKQSRSRSRDIERKHGKSRSRSRHRDDHDSRNRRRHGRSRSRDRYYSKRHSRSPRR